MVRAVLGPGCVAAGLLCLLCAAPAWAAEPARPKKVEYSPYEQETLDAALTGGKLTLDDNPEGKRVEQIDIQVLDIIEERDPVPNFLNVFHTNTKPEVVARELLLRVGDRYRQAVVDESQRNLRALRQHSLVLCRAVQGSSRGSVRLLVIVKDVWSLRLNSDFRYQGGALEYLYLEPSEENLAGTHRRIAAQFTYRPETVSFGGRLTEPRLGDSRYLFIADANVIVNQESGAAEGSYGTVQYGLPMFSTQQEWSWGALFEWKKEIARKYTGVDVKTYDAAATPWDDAIPYRYDSSTLHGRISVTRSFGRKTKQELQVAMEATKSAYDAGDLSAYDPLAASEFLREELPVTDSRFGPYLQYHLYRNAFAHMLDLETLGLQEDVALGPELWLRLYPLLSFLGSSRNVVGTYGAAAYTTKLGDGLGRVYAASTLEVDTDQGNMSDAELQGGLRLVSPRLGIGRLVYDGTVIYRPYNYLNQKSTIGGGDRLRGYPSGQFIGTDMIASNVEFRSRAIQLWTIQLAGVLFYDVGHAFNGFSQLKPQQGAGFGLRLVFPQLERAVTRIDWGFPLTPHGFDGNIFGGLVVTFRQAFGMPKLTGRTVSLIDGS